MRLCTINSPDGRGGQVMDYLCQVTDTLEVMKPQEPDPVSILKGL